MKKLLLSAILVISLSATSFAQQDPQFSQNMFNKLYTNPAYAGSNDGICGTLIYRDQWSGFEGNPSTGLFSIDAPINFLHGGLGLTILATDELGFESTFGAKLAYAFRFNIGQGNLAIGADIGLLQKSLDGDWKYDRGPSNIDDPLVPTSGVSGNTYTDLGAGIYYNSDKLYVGASMAHLLESEIDYGDFTTTMARHIYASAGYRFEFSPALSLTPSFHLKNVADQTQLDINANLHINNRFWIGGSYRLEDAIVLMAGLNITPNLRLGYSYDMTTSDLKDYSNGSHEIMLGYCYKIKKKITPIIRNVRFM
jgi:type IX secretion system PorP/SprF family membrane protein